MADYYWCHGTSCHKSRTQDRVRGSKGNKVLRTRKIRQETDREWYHPDFVMNYFCSNNCYNDFANKNAQRIIALDPRTEPLETKIEDPKKETHESRYGGYTYTTTTINKLDRDSNVG